jgi:hypothetical protein
MVTIKPLPQNYSVQMNETTLTIRLLATEKTSYTAKIDGNLTDIWGQKLGAKSVSFSG